MDFNSRTESNYVFVAKMLSMVFNNILDERIDFLI